MLFPEWKFWYRCPKIFIKVLNCLLTLSINCLLPVFILIHVLISRPVIVTVQVCSWLCYKICFVSSDFCFRLYLINSPVVRADNLKFKEEGVRDILKDVFLPWYNAYRFLMQNAERHEKVRCFRCFSDCLWCKIIL